VAGRLRDALSALAPLLSASPDDPQLLRLEGLCHERSGNLARALQSLQRAAALEGFSADAGSDLILLLTRLRRTEEAAKESDRLLQKLPDSDAARRASGEAYLADARYHDALACFDWVLARSPDDVLALLKRGFALASLGRYDDSRDAFARAQRIDAPAVENFRAALSGRPEAPAGLEPRAIHLWALYRAQCECDWSGTDALASALRDAGTTGVAAREPIFAFVSLLLPTTQAQRLALARTIAAAIEERCLPLPPPPPPASRTGAPVRVGILSPDFREHLNAHLLLPLFELADRQRIELYAYSLAADDGSAVRARIRRSAHRFRDLHLLDGLASAQQIRRDDIDVLVDVGGYSGGARFDIVARRPARSHALYLGYSGTLGSARVEYVIADRTVLPPEDIPHWAETPVYLPETWFLYDFRERPATLPRSARPKYGLPPDAFVFSAFHRAEKIEPESFALWMQVLRQVAGSILWLYAEEGRTRDNVRREASRHGMDAGRLQFAPIEPRPAYFARFGLADLLLDSLQHNATTTACDALAAGVPMLTVRGRTYTSRIGESLLRAAGLPELVADNHPDFVTRAARYAIEPGLLDAARARLAANYASAPLFDVARQVRALDAALLEMGRRARSGGPHTGFAVQ
jgi:protein O-GlcNAc transferase